MMIRRNKGEGVCVFVLFTKWCITAQSGPAILVTLYATRIIYYWSSQGVWCVCVCVYIKLHIITAQSGAVILGIPCHSHWSSQGGIDATYYENQ